MVARGLAVSRAIAQRIITERSVTVAGAIAENASRLVRNDEPIELLGPPPRFVSRAGEKLDRALEEFRIDITGKRCLDVGASTGGFTDCLLQRGAARVYAIDVGRHQLHETLRNNSHVVSQEQTNIRDVQLSDLDGAPVDFACIDVSFTSSALVLPSVRSLVCDDADAIFLIKPQFEAGRQEAAKGRGVVRDVAIWTRVVSECISYVQDAQFGVQGLTVSSILGGAGNAEFLLWMQAGVASQALDINLVIEHAKDMTGVL